VRLKVTGNKLIDPSGKSLRLTGFNWPLIHVHEGDGQLMLDKLPGSNVARLVGVLWDNSDSSSDCYMDTPPYFKESCFKKLDAAVKAATDAKVWVILAARCKYAAGSDYPTDPMANVFHNKTLANMLNVAWEHVAKHYSSWDYIGAYEVLAGELTAPSVAIDPESINLPTLMSATFYTWNRWTRAERQACERHSGPRLLRGCVCSCAGSRPEYPMYGGAGSVLQDLSLRQGEQAPTVAMDLALHSAPYSNCTAIDPTL
jgi:hypothetical protein